MTRRPRILLTHTPEMRANYYGERALAGLRALGEVELYGGAAPLTAAQVIARAEGCDLVIADRNTQLPAEVLGALPSVVAVSRVAVDIRNIDVEAASQAGILVTQASRTWVPAVAELVIGLMIDAARGISRANVGYKQGVMPEIRMGRQLSGATAGVIGYGPLGRRVVELALAFGMTVLVHDPYAAIDRGDVRQVPLDELLRAADFVLPLAVATEQTENLIDGPALSLMKADALLINLSRGNLVDEVALEQALDGGRLGGAAMDVGRAPDQMPSMVLARRADVSATPHIGGLTREAIEGQALETVAQAAEIIAGRLPKGAVNAEHASRLAAWAKGGA